MKDSDLRQAVIDELNWEPSLNAALIGVTASDGVITLTGTVASYAEKHAAESAAGRLAGVKAVVEDLEVRFSPETADDDVGLAKRAAQVLAWDIRVPSTVKIRVEKGLVTLSGEVHWKFQKDEAEADVRKLSGVVGVNNEIAIRPVVKAPAVHEKIKAALSRNAQLEAEHITVIADGGKVTLRGDVDSWLERDIAENTAWSAPGVTQVDNQLTVT